MNEGDNDKRGGKQVGFRRRDRRDPELWQDKFDSDKIVGLRGGIEKDGE
jgi:hypothetical protein